jgi:hypothetical protein
MAKKKQPEPEFTPSVLASSPWLPTSGTVTERLVIRHFKPTEYVVHREILHDLDRNSAFMYSNYFRWGPHSDSKSKANALTKAWHCFVTRATNHLNAYSVLVVE